MFEIGNILQIRQGGIGNGGDGADDDTAQLQALQIRERRRSFTAASVSFVCWMFSCFTFSGLRMREPGVGDLVIQFQVEALQIHQLLDRRQVRVRHARPTQRQVAKRSWRP